MSLWRCLTCISWRPSQLELLSETHGETVWKHTEHERAIPVVGVISGETADGKAGQHVGLPMPLYFHARDAVIQGEQFQRVDRRIILAIFEHERRYDGAYRGDF